MPNRRSDGINPFFRVKYSSTAPAASSAVDEVAPSSPAGFDDQLFRIFKEYYDITEQFGYTLKNDDEIRQEVKSIVDKEQKNSFPNFPNIINFYTNVLKTQKEKQEILEAIADKIGDFGNDHRIDKSLIHPSMIVLFNGSDADTQKLEAIRDALNGLDAGALQNLMFTYYGVAHSISSSKRDTSQFISQYKNLFRSLAKYESGDIMPLLTAALEDAQNTHQALGLSDASEEQASGVVGGAAPAATDEVAGPDATEAGVAPVATANLIPMTFKEFKGLTAAGETTPVYKQMLAVLLGKQEILRRFGSVLAHEPDEAQENCASEIEQWFDGLGNKDEANVHQAASSYLGVLTNEMVDLTTKRTFLYIIREKLAKLPDRDEQSWILKTEFIEPAMGPLLIKNPHELETIRSAIQGLDDKTLALYMKGYDDIATIIEKGSDNFKNTSHELMQNLMLSLSQYDGTGSIQDKFNEAFDTLCDEYEFNRPLLTIPGLNWLKHRLGHL